MEFHGKLYGKIAGTFFDTGKTTEDYDTIAKLLIEAADIIGSIKENKKINAWQNKYYAEIMKQNLK